MKNIFKIAIILFFLSLLYTKEKLQFSADIAKSVKNGNIITKVFQDNVEIIDGIRILYTNNATQYPDSNKVILIGDVRMYENQDSLLCEKLILYKTDVEMYEASGNVELYKQNKKIKAENLIYYIDNQIIKASNNIIMEDSLRTIQGDSLYINYKDNTIDSLIVTSNAKINNNKFINTKNNPTINFYNDYIEANRLIALFEVNGDINYMMLDGMAIADINVVQDSIFKGINNISGDTIKVYFDDNFINHMKVSGGVIGEFVPYKEYKKIKSIINYKADLVEYYPSNEISKLINNAQIIYSDNYLEGGEIQADLNNNILESKIKNEIYPSTFKKGSSPTYGDYMLFNLETELGNIVNGYQEIDLGLFKGDNFISNPEENIYINNAIFTSCDHTVPHYYIRSKQMKVMNQNNRIIAKPLIMHIQDFPAFTVPFAVLPNSTKKRKSGYLMPSFGHSSKLGTYMKDLGYYYAPNDYIDIETYLDFYDRSKVTLDSRLRYNKRYGDRWYNYRYKGFINIDNYITKLPDGDNDFTNLSDNGYKSYLISFDHIQYFDLNHSLDFHFETTYDELDDIDYITNAEIYESDYKKLMSYYVQNSNLNYSNKWGNHTLSIYTYENNNQDYKSIKPTQNKEKTYNTFQLPIYTYNYVNPSLFGVNDKWYSSIFFKFNSKFNEGQFEKKKQVIDDGTGEYIWSNDDKESFVNPYIKHSISLGNSFNIFNYIKIVPSISYNEEWAIEYKSNLSIFSFSDYLSHRVNNPNFIEDYNIIGRKSNGRISVNMNTAIYGNYPISKKKSINFKHIFVPTINHSYSSETQFIKGNKESFQNHNTIRSIIDDYSAITTLSFKNLFNIEKIDNNGIKHTRKFLRYDITGLSYNWNTELFGNLNSSLGFRDKNDREFLTILMRHSLYREDDISKFRDKPKLMSLSTSFSKNFNLNFSGQQSNIANNSIEDEEQSNIENNNNEQANTNQSNNNVNHMNPMNNISDDNIWDSSLNLSLTAKYDLINKWVVDYSNLGVRFNIKLTKEWKMNNNIVLNLAEKKLQFYEIEFKRSLHCWDFSFIMRPIGYSKGFSLKINLSKPSLQTVKITQSTRKFH